MDAQTLDTLTYILKVVWFGFAGLSSGIITLMPIRGYISYDKGFDRDLLVIMSTLCIYTLLELIDVSLTLSIKTITWYYLILSFGKRIQERRALERLLEEKIAEEKHRQEQVRKYEIVG